MSTTANRFAHVHSEIHDLAIHKHEKDIGELARSLDKRSVIFINALISLYLSITFLALEGLIGGLAVIWMGNIFYIVVGLSCFGNSMFSFCFAAAY